MSVAAQRARTISLLVIVELDGVFAFRILTKHVHDVAADTVLDLRHLDRLSQRLACLIGGRNPEPYAGRSTLVFGDVDDPVCAVHETHRA